MHQVEASPNISKKVLDVLYAELKSWCADIEDLTNDNAFRYGMFAGRLVAAEYGRPDAVQWAQEWHDKLIADRAAIAEAYARVQQEAIDRIHREKEHTRAEFLAGRVGNPLYQAYLDTVEDPATVKNNADYFAFHSTRSAEFQQFGAGMTFLQFVRNYADQHLAKRLKN